MKVDVVLVHTGNFFPDYINDCISQLKKYDFNIHLIITSKLNINVLHNDIILANAEDYFNEEYNSYQINNHDIFFRDGFWTRTSSRFILINSYAEKNNLSSFFHIENDVLMFCDLKDVKKHLYSTKYEMAVVIDSERRCIPSIMYFRNQQISRELSKFILKNRNENDMFNIFNFFMLNREKVANLPILPIESGIDLISRTGISYSGNIDYCNMYNDFMSIFDGAAIGQYIGGIDFRNNLDNTVGFVNETTIFDVSKLKYIWENSKPYIISDDRKIPINNIHVHSKNMKKIMNM